MNMASGLDSVNQPELILVDETSGLIPSTEYYDRVYGKEKWTQGNLVSLGIGQGEIGVSPLQMARYVAALANDGTLLQPHAVSFYPQ